MLIKNTLNIVALPKQQVSLRLFWQFATLALLVTGYAGYYLCRSDLSVALPMISAELASKGMDPAVARLRLGSIASLGVLAYALAKLASGGIADFFGGRRNFLVGMGGSVLFTFLFAFSGGVVPLMTMVWIGNRAIQATGWAGMVKICSRWFSSTTYGTVMAIISLSYLFGDAAARQFMAVLIGRGFGWREVFYIAGGTLFAIWLLTFIFLKETPLEIGESEPEINPRNLFGAEGKKSSLGGVFQLLRPLLSSREFRLLRKTNGPDHSEISDRRAAGGGVPFENHDRLPAFGRSIGVSQPQYARSNNGDICLLHPPRVAGLLYLRISVL